MSKSNTKIVEEVIADYKERREARRSLESQWQLNINFMMGNQYSYIASNGGIKQDEKPAVEDVKDEILDSETLALKLIAVLKTDYSERLTERFKITDFTDKEDYEILEMIGRKRGFLISGGEIDFERASVILLDEYRAGKLGKLTLEYPREYE